MGLHGPPNEREFLWTAAPASASPAPSVSAPVASAAPKVTPLPPPTDVRAARCDPSGWCLVELPKPASGTRLDVVAIGGTSARDVSMRRAAKPCVSHARGGWHGAP